MKRVVFLTEEEFDGNVRFGSPESVLSPAEQRAVKRSFKEHLRERGDLERSCQIVYCVVMPDEVV